MSVCSGLQTDMAVYERLDRCETLFAVDADADRPGVGLVDATSDNAVAALTPAQDLGAQRILQQAHGVPL